MYGLNTCCIIFLSQRLIVTSVNHVRRYSHNWPTVTIPIG